MSKTTWKPIEELDAESQEYVRQWFKDDPESIVRYEFDKVAGKLLRRVRPELINSAKKKAPEAGTKAPRSANKPGSGKSALAAAATESGVGDTLDRIHRISVEDLEESPTNPRKHFNPDRLRELADSLRVVGIINPLLVRPLGEKYEIVAGHRRWRAALLAELPTVPVTIRDLTDEQVVDRQLIENLQREDLDPIEEAESLAAMLDLKNDEGAPRWTMASLAARLGKTAQHVADRIRMLRLPPPAREALQGGTIGDKTAILIARVPSTSLRGKLTKEVLKGFGDGALSARETKDHIRRNYMVELRATPFDQKDSKLVPVVTEGGERVKGGACLDCPHNSANMPEAGEQRIHLCTLPTCYQEKLTANISHIKDKALNDGAVVVEGEKARRLIYPDGTPHHDSGMVNIATAPAAGEHVGTKKPPTWKKMLTGEVQPNVTVVIDEKGKAHHLVPRKLAVEAAIKNGFEDVFSARSGGRENNADNGQAAREAAERLKKKIESATAVAGMESLVSEISKRGLGADAMAAMLEIALFHAAADALAFVCNRRSLTVVKNRNDQPDREQAIRMHAETLLPECLTALIVEILLAAWVKCAGVGAAGFVAMAEAYEIDVAAIKAEVKAKNEGPKLPRAKIKKPDPEPKPVREFIAELAAKRNLTAADLDTIAQRTTGKTLADARGPELNAIADAVKETAVAEPETENS